MSGGGGGGGGGQLAYCVAQLLCTVTVIGNLVQVLGGRGELPPCPPNYSPVGVDCSTDTYSDMHPSRAIGGREWMSRGWDDGGRGESKPCHCS